jgi:hypothetical protein
MLYSINRKEEGKADKSANTTVHRLFDRSLSEWQHGFEL